MDIIPMLRMSFQISFHRVCLKNFSENLENYYFFYPPYECCTAYILLGLDRSLTSKSLHWEQPNSHVMIYLYLEKEQQLWLVTNIDGVEEGYELISRAAAQHCLRLWCWGLTITERRGAVSGLWSWTTPPHLV